MTDQSNVCPDCKGAGSGAAGRCKKCLGSGRVWESPLVDRIRGALRVSRDCVMESFDNAVTIDEQYLAEARLRDIDDAVALLPKTPVHPIHDGPPDKIYVAIDHREPKP